MPTEIPDFTGYGLLGAFVAVVFIFLLFGVVFVRSASRVLGRLGDACHEHNADREERMLECIRENSAALRENRETHAEAREAFRSAQVGFRELATAVVKHVQNNGRR